MKEMMHIKKSYIKILRDIEKVLSDQPMDFVKLGKAVFGIFRLVTDGPGDDPIAQELLSLLEKIYFFRKIINEING